MSNNIQSEPVAWMDNEGWFIRPRERSLSRELQETYTIPLYTHPDRRAAVTAKALGLVPVVERWVPDLGEIVVVTGPAGVMGTTKHIGEVGPIYKHNTVHSVDAWYLRHIDAWFDASNIRPATDAEIAAHLAEQEAKKPVEFGTRVTHEGRQWRLACDSCDEVGKWTIAREDVYRVTAVKKVQRNEFTVID